MHMHGDNMVPSVQKCHVIVQAHRVEPPMGFFFTTQGSKLYFLAVSFCAYESVAKIK